MPGLLPRPLMDEDTVDEIAAQVRLSGSYLLFMATSGVLASIALMTD